MKKALVKKKIKKATLLYIPESESVVKSFVVPFWSLKLVAAFFAILFIFSTININNIAQISNRKNNNRKEIDRLLALNALQKDQIQSLQTNALKLESEISDNIQLLNKIKKTIGIKTVNPSGNTEGLQKSVDILESIDVGTKMGSDMSNEIDNINKSLSLLSNQTKVQKEDIKKSIAPIKAKLAYLRAIPSIKPINDAITCPYGYRKNPFTHRGSEFHKGVDLGAEYGVDVHATGDGEVIFAGWNGGYGNLVIVSHGYGLTTLYAHNSKLLVKTGDKIKRGQAVAKTGSTGRSTAPHVHYEVRVDGKHVDPTKYF